MSLFIVGSQWSMIVTIFTKCQSGQIWSPPWNIKYIISRNTTKYKHAITPNSVQYRTIYIYSILFLLMSCAVSQYQKMSHWWLCDTIAYWTVIRLWRAKKTGTPNIIYNIWFLLICEHNFIIEEKVVKLFVGQILVLINFFKDLNL